MLFVSTTHVSAICAVVLCPHLCTSDPSQDFFTSCFKLNGELAISNITDVHGDVVPSFYGVSKYYRRVG